jgi:hypothetical protein
MSRKLSLATIALCATLLAVPAMAQQPAGKDSTKATTPKATTAMGKHHKHHKGAAAAAKDTTTKK